MTPFPALLIVGSGAMACLFGSQLAPLGDVTLIGRWQAQINAIQQAGLTIIHPDGRREQRPLTLHAPPFPPQQADIALILVKSDQTERAAHDVAPLLKGDGVAVTLQNGLGNRETLAAVLGTHRVAQATTSEGASLIAPGVLHHAGRGQTYLANSHRHIPRLADWLTEAGFTTELSDNVDGLVWGKLAINAAINPLTALLDVANGFLADDAAARHQMLAIAREVQAVAHAQGIHLPYADAGDEALRVAQATRANSSSMRQDIRNGRSTEIEAICGAIIRLGRQHNVPTPLNEQLYQQVREMRDA